MYSEALIRYTDALTNTTSVTQDNSLKDVRGVLEKIVNPPVVLLQEVRRLHSTESLLTLTQDNFALTFHCFIGSDAFSIKKSHLVVDGKRREWSWNKDLNKFKFDAGATERRVLHNFLTAVVSAL